MRSRRTEPAIDIRSQHDPEVNASLYVSSELPRRLIRWFEQHLLECDDCWQEVWLARRGRFLAEHARELAPAGLRDAVRGEVQISAAGDDDPGRGRSWLFDRRWRRGR